MVDLYRRAGSPFWYFDETLPDGTRRRLSTRTGIKADAKRVAEARIGRLREEAAMPGEPISLAAALDRYATRLETAGKASAAGTRALANKMLGLVRRGDKLVPTGRFKLDGSALLHTLTTAHAERLHEERLAEGASIQTANHEVKVLRAAVNLAARRGLKVPTLKVALPAPPQKTRWLEWAEWELVYAHLDPASPVPTRWGGEAVPGGRIAVARQEAQDLLVALTMTGGRWNEVASLRWDMVDLVAWQHIRLWGFKDKQERLVPIPPQFEDVLRRRWAARRNSPLIFPGADGDAPRPQPSRAIGRAMDRAGLNDAHKVSRYGRATIHSLRHTFASWLLQRGLSLSEVQALLGHASPTMTARYAHLAVGQTINRASQALMEMT
jgi:integrase